MVIMTALLCMVVEGRKLPKQSTSDDEKHSELVLELAWESRVPGGKEESSQALVGQ